MIDRLAVRRHQHKQLDDPGVMSGKNYMPTFDKDRRPAFDQTAVLLQNGIPHNLRQGRDILARQLIPLEG
ncbi:MAG: hypothetical protein VYD85_13410, partial [Pseudomonadota bacterium]|nr:hypothetical protein [Pseudomonadota bacterium]